MPRERPISSQDFHGREAMAADTDHSAADHGPTKKVLDKVSLLKALVARVLHILLHPSLEYGV